MSRLRQIRYEDPDKTQHRPESLFPTILWIMPFAPTLLTALNRLHRRVDIDMDLLVPQPAQLPHPLPKSAHNHQ
jgi:hypothetical protein